jgi:hypothetical protein
MRFVSSCSRLCLPNSLLGKITLSDADRDDIDIFAVRALDAVDD